MKGTALAATGESQVVFEGPGASYAGDWETWDAYFINNRQVGYSHMRARSTDPIRPASDVRYELDSRLYVNQGSIRLLQHVSQTCTETSEGRLTAFEGVVSVGPARTRVFGTFENGELRVETLRGASRTIRAIPWNPTFRGLVALEQSLRQRPLQHKGEERMLKMLLPGRYELATARLRCLGKASVPLLDGLLHELTEINCEIQAEDGPPTFSTIWTEDNGEIARTHSPALQLIAYRTDEHTATSFEGNDQVVASLLVTGEIKEPQATKRVGYKIQPTAAAKLAKIVVEFKPAPGQFVRSSEGGVLQVLVSRREESPGKGFAASDWLPTDGDLAANSWIDFNHEEIRKLQTIVLRGDQLPKRETAIELTKAVHQITKERSETGVAAKASNVAKYLSADSTERAILLTAFLRGRNIPTRIVLGLKYLPGSPARLVYHPWVIAYVDESWIHLDPSEGGLAAADRLVFTTADFANGDEFEAVVPLLETMRAMQVEIAGQN